jgi:uncharacterized membrane protein YdjX (TVP38/TMEM64 family)
VIDWLQGLLSTFEGLGPLGYVLFVVAYVFATLILFPEAIFTLLAGALFGTVWGSVIAWCCALAGSFAAFLLTRIWLREHIEKHFEKNRWLKAVNRSLPEEGWKVVALARLSPLVPFGMQNYLFGVTKVKRRDYFVATSIAIVPGTVIYAFLGSTGRQLLGSETSGWTWAMLAGGIVASIVLSLLLGRLAKKRLGIDR